MDEGHFVFCAAVFKMFIRKHMNYYNSYDTDRNAAFSAAYHWVKANNALYKAKMRELALAPIGFRCSPFEYGNDFTVVALEDVKWWACVFLSSLHAPKHPADRCYLSVDHFMQKACEYLFTEYEKHQAAIEIAFIESRAESRRGKDTKEEQEEDKARLLHLRHFVLGTECPICFEVSELLAVCKNSHAICRQCFDHPSLKKCPLCRGELLHSSP